MSRKYKYQEAMDRVRVDEEMYARVLAGVRAHLEEEADAPEHTDRKRRAAGRRARIIRFVPVIVAAAAALLLVMTVPGITDRTGSTGTETEDGSTGPMASAPYQLIEQPDLASLKEATGLPVEELRDIPFEVNTTTYLSDTEGMAEILYEGSTNTITYRMAAGTEDISGDYNDYSGIHTAAVGDVTVTLKGNDGTVSLAIWTDGTYAYSIMTDEGIAEEEMLRLVSSL